MKVGLRLVLAAGLLVLSAPAMAQIKVGVILSLTGPGSAICIPEQRALPLMPRTIGGTPVEYIVLDDASDTTQGVQAGKQLLLRDHVDLVIGPATTPVSIAITDMMQQGKVPVISLSGAAVVVEPAQTHRWIFKTPQNDAQMAEAIADDMVRKKIGTVGFIGFTDAYGQSWLSQMGRLMNKHGIKVLATERFARTDTTVTGQVLRLMGEDPEAIFVAASGTPAVLPQASLKDRGYTGPIYQTHGAVVPEFIAVGGHNVDGTLLPTSPSLVVEELPADYPNREVASAFIKSYAALPGQFPRSVFAGYMYDAGLIMTKAIEQALPKAKPGTEEFRSALRDAIESTKDLVTSTGIVTMSPTDHVGLDKRARVMVEIKDGQWRLAK